MAESSGIVARLASMMHTRCACFFPHRTAEQVDRQIRDRTAAINASIRDAVEPLTDRAISVRDVTGRNQQGKGSLYKQRKLALTMMRGGKRGSKGPVLSWTDEDGEQQFGEVCEVRQVEAASANEGLTTELGTVQMPLLSLIHI
eukprot:TRINITY_DN29610_c0_g1_i1.p1 TRINITY_DN29610_c0_g1~~TRINITY_DN29610_c0_g1_i1.p1  ORF type:complete len:144 (-),score=31.95 TRINITY_DN29610_c0_g1_i1:84-515(-)